MAPSNKKKGAVDEALAGATEKVLKEIAKLYDSGLNEGSGKAGAGTVGLRSIADSSQLQMVMRKPRKKVSIMIVGNHSAGKSSFINWYIGEQIQKTGVAIETRGFTFVTSGKKRETLTGDATMRYFDFLSGFTKFEGIIPNLFTEISTSKEKNFLCVDFIDTPGLVDGDMQYPFDVQEAILWMAEHVDLILVFFDPIGQATCKRTMQVVEKLNNGPHLEKIHYFMSKADAVEKEHDRQRVLIQITQNLATRIRNSHAFNLPTFYLPRDDGEASAIPNAIEEVCKEIDKSINMTVQKNLRLLKEDCERILARCDVVQAEDKVKKARNLKVTLQGLALMSGAWVAGALLLGLLAARVMPAVCRVADHMCQATHIQTLVRISPAVQEHFALVGGVLLVVMVVLLVASKLTWKTAPVFNKKDLKKLDEHRAVTKAIMSEESDLYQKYFDTLSHAER
uniref:Dynamin N-terminal domain-containing protein n=1 Tax=Chlamydomonas leiostraca TaxID=1034604 RepID=A0A6T8UFK0_9CHLO|mmetsp:Transcript_3438/g.8558  ORF Transcript_3438/g.8558 Transcript_3438/m.8558 type:complete len:452 (+) Transcript_3438:72-1427(+)